MNQQEWEEHYCTAAHSEPKTPDTLLTDNRPLLTGGMSLDIATGSGRNAFFLAECGYHVIAVDRAKSAALLVNKYARSRRLSIDVVAADMLDINFGTERFDLITNFYFLERELIPRIKQSLKPGGLVFFETFTSYQIPRNDPRYRKFLIDPNELLTMFSDFFIMYYFERIKGSKSVASMIAKKV